jgi:hypothetical protein
VQQPFIGLEPVRAVERRIDVEGERDAAQVEHRPRDLGLDFNAHLRVVGELEDQLAGAHALLGRVLGEQPQRRVGEADGHRSASLGQRLARAQVEGDPAPPPGVDPHLDRGERLHLRVIGNSLRVPVAVVLAKDNPRAVQGTDRIKQLGALQVQALGVHPAGRLQGHDSENLKQVSDHHVAKRPGLLVEPRPALDIQILGHVDLDVGDVVAVPDGLEDPVGEPQRQDVLGRLLAQEVVDPVDRLLLQDVVEGRVELLGAGLVVAEGLLDHQRAVLRDPARPQHPHHVLHRPWRH